MAAVDQLPRLDKVQLAGLIAETLLNGYFHRKHSFPLKPLTLTAMFLFITITGHWITDILLAYDAFIQPRSSEFHPPSNGLTPAENTYLNLADRKSVAGSGFYVASTLIGDSFMTYRLHIVWSRNIKIIVAPVLMCLALTASGTMVTYLFSQANSLAIFKAAGSWITVCFTLTFVCNLYSTSLIAIKIFLTNKAVSVTRIDRSRGGIGKVVEIIVESAALYSCCILAALITYVSHSNLQFVFVNITNPVIGIIFCMIITRSYSISHKRESEEIPFSSIRLTRRESSANNSRFTIQPLAVKISTSADVKGDSGQEICDD